MVSLYVEMSLLDDAELAERIGNAFAQHRVQVPEYAQDISAAIAKLNGLGWALREIHRCDQEHSDGFDTIESDLKFVHKNIVITLDKVWYIIGGIGNGNPSLQPEDYRRNWKEISQYCRSNGDISLTLRLDLYERFALILCQRCKRQQYSKPDLKSLRQNIVNLGQLHDPKLLAERRASFRATNQPFQTISKKESYERHRGIGSGFPQSPTNSTSTEGQQFSFQRNDPTPPMSPISPSTTMSTVSQISSTTSHEHHNPISDHWAQAVFRDASETPLVLPRNREPSVYHEFPKTPNQGLPSAKYQEALTISFQPSLRVCLYHNPADHKAKMSVSWPVDSKRDRIICLPLHSLELRRSRATLQVCRLMRDGKSMMPWVSLQFTTIERLILFACTLIAMRSYYGRGPNQPIWTDEYLDEKTEYNGCILEGPAQLRHTLSIYRDSSSKSVRLQGSIHGGLINGTPVWTAWITHSCISPSWCEVVSKKMLILRDTRLHIFRDSRDYKPEISSDGGFVLRFERSVDATGFIDAINDLREKAQRRRLNR